MFKRVPASLSCSRTTTRAAASASVSGGGLAYVECDPLRKRDVESEKRDEIRRSVQEAEAADRFYSTPSSSIQGSQPSNASASDSSVEWLIAEANDSDVRVRGGTDGPLVIAAAPCSGTCSERCDEGCDEPACDEPRCDEPHCDGQACDE